MTPQDFLARFTSYGPLVAALILVAVVATLAVFRLTRRSTSRVSARWRMLLFDSILVIGLFTLLPAEGGGQSVNWALGSGVDIREFAANVALYVPAGFCLMRASVRPRWLSVIVLGVLGPVIVEVLQNVLALGRISDVNDVLANGIGTLIGLVLAGLSWGRS